MGWFWANFITLTLTNISWWIPFNFIEGMTPIHNYKWKTILKALKVALPILPHQNGLYLLSKSDRVVMDLVGVSTSNIGLYNVSNNVATPMQMVEQAYSKSMQPYIQELIRSKDHIKLKSLFTYSQLIFFCLVLAYSSIAKEFIEFLIRNDELNDIYQLSVLMVMVGLSKPMYMASNSLLFYYEKTKAIGMFTILAGVITVLLNVLLIPSLGFEVAALNGILGYMILAYSRFWTKDFKSLSKVKYYPIFWLGLNIVIVYLGYHLATLQLMYRLIVLLFTITTICIIIYKLNRIIK